MGSEMCIRDRAAAMGQRGKEQVAQRYSWAVEEKALLSVYARLTATGRDGRPR